MCQGTAPFGPVAYLCGVAAWLNFSAVVTIQLEQCSGPLRQQPYCSSVGPLLKSGQATAIPSSMACGALTKCKKLEGGWGQVILLPVPPPTPGGSTDLNQD